jgi:GNAT superfamily N-acetyltransferase
MDLRSHASASAFLDEVGPRLEQHEAANSLILGLARRVVAGFLGDGDTPYIASVRNNGDVVLAAFMTPPYPLVLAATSPEATAGLPDLIDHLRQLHPSIPAVTANGALADHFAATWSRATGAIPGGIMRQGIFELTEPASMAGVRGRMRIASTDDEAALCAWYAAFAAEAMGVSEAEVVGREAKARIERRELYVWDDGIPRAMAGRARPTRNTVTVNAVYTPPEFRRSGYATALVAALSADLLAEGYRACVLYTDLSNPTSNSIYQKIGYRRVAESARIGFVGA